MNFRDCEPMLQRVRDEIVKSTREQREAFKRLVEAQNTEFESQLTALLQKVEHIQRSYCTATIVENMPEAEKLLQEDEFQQDNIVDVHDDETADVPSPTLKGGLKHPCDTHDLALTPVDSTQGSFGSRVTGEYKRPTWVRTIQLSQTSRWSGVAQTLRTHSGKRRSSLPRRCLDRLASCMDWFSAIQEPERNTRLATFVRSRPVEVVTALVIGANALFVGYTTNYEMEHLNKQPTNFILGVELFFLGFYTVEILLKLLVHRAYFFVNKDGYWNTFDLLVLLFTYFDNIAVFLFWGQGASTNLTFMRMLRIFKMVKVVRTLKAMRFFRELRLLMDCVLGSFIQLFWCLAMIIVVLYMFALIFVQGMAELLLDASIEEVSLDRSQREKVIQSFGSVQNGMVTLFQAITGGVDWSREYELVILTGWVRGGVFLFFIVFFVIAVWNIMMSMFVQQILTLAKPDLDALMLEKRRRDDLDAKELRGLFERLQISSTEVITADEFERCLVNEAFASFLLARGVDIKEARTFFTMLSNSNELENGGVDIGTVMGSCLRIKGFATSVDLHILRYEMRMATRKQHRNMEKALNAVARVEAYLNGKSPRSHGLLPPNSSPTRLPSVRKFLPPGQTP